MQAEERHENRRIDLWLALAVLFALVLAFWPAWKSLVGIWSSSEDFSHGFIIVPAALYLLWRRREAVTRRPPRPSWMGLPVVLGATLVYLFALLAGVWTLAYLAIILALIGAVLFVGGWRILRECAFPLFLLLFMIPVPSQIYTYLTAPLQLFVSQVTAGTVKLLQIPVYREGNILHLPGHSFQVIQACSGLRSVMSLLTLGLLLGYLTLRSNSLRTLLFIAGLPVAIAVNVVRVLAMVLALHYLDLDLTAGEVHTWFGLGIFGLAVALLYLLRGVLAKWDRSAAAG
ncbi:MAG: exosortase [Desulfuromonadales bacterium]|nr:exosortase [Desulfuromonadales bacterium]